MSWRDRLRPGSFRGAPFRLAVTDAELGRRVALQKLPGRKGVVDQDFGEDAGTYSIQAYVIGPDYDIARDELERALLTEGPGRLVHPTRGEMLVVVHPGIRVRENPTSEGGFAQLTFTVTEKDAAEVAVVGFADAERMRNAADSLIAELAAEFEATLDTSGLPASAIDSHVSALATAAAAMNRAAATLGGLGATVSGLSDVAQTFTSSAESVLAAPGALASTTQTALLEAFVGAAQVVDTATDQVELVRRRRTVVESVLRAAGQILRSSTRVDFDDSTSVRIRETTNLRALDALIRVSTFGALGMAIPDLPWSSYQEAVGARRRIGSMLDDLLADVPDSQLGAVLDLRVAAAAFLDGVASTLPELRSVVIERETSTLLLAQELLGDASREPEILARSSLEHPGLVPAGSVVEVPNA